MDRRRLCILSLGLLALLALTPAARAVITRLVPMQEILKETTYIVTAKVESLDPAKLTAVLSLDEKLKDIKSEPFALTNVLINLTGDDEAKKGDHTNKLLKRLAPKMTVVLFVTLRNDTYTVFGYTNGTWFQMIGKKTANPADTVFAFTHCEPFLTRTFKGTTEEMKKVVVDGLAGKAKPPAPNANAEPGFGPEVMPPAKEAPQPLAHGVQPTKDRQPAQLQADKKWFRVIAENGNGMALAAPLIAGNRAYVAVGHGALARFGVLYCIDLDTKKTLWTFDAAQKMKHCYSSPVLAGGRIFIGEGLHDDQNCNLYCIDAATGKQHWAFATGSHTESTPVVVGGKVFFGAGDDGVYCVDAVSGKKIWQFAGPPKLPLHVDSTPAVVGKHLFLCGGIDEEAGGNPAICCVETATGNPVWCQRTPKWLVKLNDAKAAPQHVPAWGSPVVADGVVYIGVGTGRVNAPSVLYQAVGGILALETAGGKEVWPPFKVADGVLESPVIDSATVYFGSRDGHCYAIARKDASLRWKAPLGSAVVAPPVLVRTAEGTAATQVFVLASAGRVACLDAATGKPDWTFTDLEKAETLLVAAPTLLTQMVKNGVERRLYFSGTFNGLTTPALCCLQDLQPVLNK